MRRHIRKARALARRYGHMSMKSVEDFTGGVRKIAKENPEVTSGVVGAGLGAAAAGLGAGTGALLGGVVGVVANQMTK